ncbi:MAG TPA: CBS domain-containing protein [Verrucomicrobiae bacterium]|jgi:CBS domain-containing protein|nr:CBS domain-containing protein [Verrucomicrobiae bacterium]
MSLREFCQREVIGISPDADILEACKLMRENNIGSVVVLESGKLRGILTDRDIALKVTGTNNDPRTTKARDVMTQNPVRISVDKELQHLTNVMRVHHVRRVPIVDDANQVLGIVTMDDVVARISAEIFDLGNTIAETLPMLAA